MRSCEFWNPKILSFQLEFYVLVEIYGKRLCPLNLTQDVFKLDCKQFLCYSWTCDIVKTLFVRCLYWRWRLLIARTKLHLVSERWKLRILRQMRWSLPQTWGDPFFRELYKLCFVYSWQSCGFKERLRLQSRMVSLLIHDGKLLIHDHITVNTFSLRQPR